MINISDKIGGNQNTQFVFNNLFHQNIVPFMRKCRKICYRRAGHRWEYNMAYALWML